MSVHCANASYFNPLPRKEGDQLPFQNQCSYPAYFNPLPRKEGDRFKPLRSVNHVISIHSLVKRETKIGQRRCFATLISIHSLVKRETLMHV